MPKNDNKYYYYCMKLKVNDPKLVCRVLDNQYRELKDLHFKNEDPSNPTALTISVKGNSDLFTLDITITRYAKRLSTPIMEAQSFHTVKISPRVSVTKTPLKLRYRLFGTEEWLITDDGIIKVQYNDDVYEAQLHYDIQEFGVTIESPIIVVKQHWKQMQKFLRINREELATKNTFSANFNDRCLAYGTYTATLEHIDSTDSTKDIITLNSLASTIFYSSRPLKAGERYLFKFFVTSLSRPRSADVLKISKEFTVPPELNSSPAQTEAWIAKFGKDPLKYSNSKFTLSLNPNGWFTLNSLHTTPRKALAGSFHLLAAGSEDSLELYPLIKDKYIERAPLAFEGDESDAPVPLRIPEILLHILGALPFSSNRLVCKFWCRILPLRLLITIDTSKCVLKFIGDDCTLSKLV